MTKHNSRGQKYCETEGTYIGQGIIYSKLCTNLRRLSGCASIMKSHYGMVSVSLTVMRTELFSPCHPVHAGWTFVTSVVAIWALFLFTNLDAIEAILNSHSGKIKLPLEENMFTLICSHQYILSSHAYTHAHGSRNARGLEVNLVSWLSPHWIKWSLRKFPNSPPGPEYFMTNDLHLSMYPDLVKSRHKSCFSSSLNAQIQNLW